MNTVDVVIPHYGDDELLETCVGSFKTSPLLCEALIENNNEENRGFTKAVNDGIKRSFEWMDVQYVAIVNNDVRFVSGQDPFYSLVKRMEEDESLAIVGPTIVHSENNDQIVHAGGMQVFPNGLHKSGLVSLGQHQKPTYELWLSFPMVLIRKDALCQVGLLDEKMWLICSDSDWCMRARYAGWKCGYEPGETWEHDIGESGEATSEWSYKVQRRDMLAFHKKWIEPAGLFTELDKEVLPEI